MLEQKHALLSASSAHRWLVCTPSALLEQQEDSECSVYAQEGTAAHELAEIKLSFRFKKITQDEYEEKFTVFKESEFGKAYYNKEFEEFVDEFVEYVVSQTENVGDFHIFFELRVNFSNVVPQGYGTSDVVIVTEDCVHVIDLKFGAGIPVSAKENPQLRLYAMGAVNIFPNTERIKTTIYQPRLFSYDSEELSKRELLEWAIEIVKPRAEEAIKGEGILTPTKDACKFCKLRSKCKVRADFQLEAAQKEFSVVDQKANLVQNIPVEQIARILEIAPAFIDWFKDVQAYALGQLAAGVKIPGYKLVEGRSNRIITDDAKVRELLLKVGLTDNEIMKPQEMLGISKLEAIIGKKLFADLCKDYLIKPMGKLTLAPESDRRPELSCIALAQSDFAEAIEN